MNLELNGKVAMIAAASKGLGRATAASLIREGCRVSICARNPATLAAVRDELSAKVLNAEVLAVPSDVSRPADLKHWHNQTVATLGPVDILVTNTGGPPAARFTELSEAQWATGIDSTLLNVVRLCRLVIPAMQARRWGRIVHITSLAAKQPVDLLTISSTLRAGLSALTKTMANQLAADNILVNAILPGHIQTERQDHLNQLRAREVGCTVAEYAARVQREIPLGRYGRAQEIGDVIAFLCSERTSYLTGVSLQVDGGLIQSTF
jgi:3-oxoacyl-[acyl-carrier protein] reductase